MMKRIIASLFAVLLLLLAFVLIAPNFIDWNRHKDLLAAQAANYLQREVSVKGGVSFRLLPNPQLKADDVTVAAIDGAKEPALLKLKSIEAKVRFKPLLEGRVEIEKIHLVEPQLTLEVLPDGRASWQGLMQGASTSGAAGDAIALNDVSLQGGKIRYLQAAAGVDETFDQLNLSVTAASLRGSYKITGDMTFKKTPVNIEITTGQAQGARGIPVAALFQPVDTLPQITLKGDVSAAGGMGFDGTLSLDQGAPASLFTQPFLTQAGWLKNDMKLTATLSARAGEMTLRDIDGTFGKAGKLGGSVSLIRQPMEIPHLRADISLTQADFGKDLPLRLAVPEGMQADVKITARQARWRGAVLPSVRLDASSKQGEWQIKSFQADLADKSVLTLSGSVQPQQSSASFKIGLSGDNAAGFGKHYGAMLSPRLSMLWPLLPAGDWSLSGNLDMRGDRASLYNFESAFGAAGKASGVLNMLLDGAEARLNVAGLDIGDMDENRRGELTRAFFSPGNDIDLTAENITIGGAVWNGVMLKASSRADGVTLSSFTGRMGDTGQVTLSGSFSAAPVAAADKVALDFDVSVPDAAALGKAAGFEWPMPLNMAVPVQLQGEWRRDTSAGQPDSYKIKGGFYGGKIDMQSRGVDAARITLALPDSQRALGLFGFGIDRLISPAGGVTLTLDRQMRADGFTLDNLRIENREGLVASGRATKTGANLAADLRVAKANIDRWISADIRQPGPLSLKLRADEALVRGAVLKDAEMDLTVGTGRIGVNALKAGLWDGALSAAGGLQRGEDGQWSAQIKGGISGFRLLQFPISFRGLDADEGEMSFDLAAKPQDKNALADLSGQMSLSVPRLTVDGFDPAALAAYLEPLQNSPQDLISTAHKILRGGAATYRDVHAEFDIKGSDIAVRSLMLNNLDSNVKVEAKLDSAKETYDLKSFMTLKNVRGLEPLVIVRSGSLTEAPDFHIEPKALSDFGASRMPREVAPAVPAVPAVLPDGTDGVAPQDGEMLPPGYLDVPGSDGAEAGEIEILPVEQNPLPDIEPSPAADAVPGAAQQDTPVQGAEPAQQNTDPIKGILDRL